ncbi:5'-AMP-activated protein kinase-related, putative isoform 2 [Hibiscus syriacus]|uniref:5'-AMP-activated protein kinase-related, putative isoform 2 n=1 Tax=Hibiscus syriacus TaxID=106335 RepID=A0A6A3CPH4_HIBSY|nr:protein PTST homolog 3, chloroplastic-like isoform X2 [Hibiscus syriacus]KAE8731063.1 5'-AMP-activated protein kinase-related, putative isoform 2 [Hibiscus syriacus]
MATLFQIQTFLSLSSNKPIFSSKPQQWPSWITHEYKPRRNLKICAFSAKRPRSGRKVKSNEELCTDIREFVAAVGLPEGHVPSLKQLSQYGRSDLANILKRRGYKPIKQLLSSSPKTDRNGFVAEKRVAQKHDATGDSEDTFKGQYEKSENAIEDVSLPTDVFNMENNLVGEGVDSSEHNYMKETTVPTLGCQNEMEGAMLEDASASAFFPVDEDYSRSLNVNLRHNSDNNILIPEEPAATSSLEKKVANFVQNGDLDAIEYDVYKILNEGGEKESKEVVRTNNEVATQSIKRSEEHSGHAYDAPITSTGSATVAEQVAPPVAMDYLPWREAQTLKDNDLREGLDSETNGRDNLIEINHLKFMLHQKELELSHLKEQIEKEKMALSSLQTKAEMEIQKVQKLVSEKDAELQAAEESLSGLQEVQLEYSGDGEIVEVSGSFNGWHHRIKMDHKPSSIIENPIESSKSKIWSTVLWLYPGVYEIKFIVDGEWKLDPERETTSNGRICNNILRVDR